jgi:hypothetical protein
MWYWTKDLIIDPADANQNTWYVCVFTGWGNNAGGNKGGLYRTTNRGQSWTKLTGSQFDRVTSITFNPQNYNQAYLTTEMQGLWRSNDMNAATPNWSLVNGYNFRQPERVFFNPYDPDEMWVTSFGNGLKVTNIAAGVKNINSEKAVAMNVYPNPADDMVYVELSPGKRGGYIEVYDASGRLVQKLSAAENGIHCLNVRDWVPGMYFVGYGRAHAKFMKN